MIYRYSGSVVSDLEVIREYLDNILRDINKYLDDEEMLFDLRLILNELVINSALHGNELMDNKKIRLDIKLSQDEVEILVEDEGEGIDYDISSYDPLEMKCCGRGLFIVNSLSDDCLIDNNRVIVTKKIL